MKQLALAFGLCAALSSPALAQEDDGSSLMERGAQQFLEGLLKEMEPAWQGMQEFMDQMGPAMIDLMDEIKDWSAYEPPEVLENGDIIIRRKPEPEDPGTEPQTDTPNIEL
jgi:hypothetical protein